MNVLLSIKPKYVDEILAGKKIFEFRKAIFKKKDLGKVFIYSSSPVKKVVASFEIARIIADSPQKLWDKCHKYGGIPENDFFEYFKNSDVAYAIEITNLETFSEPFDPYKLKKDFRPPQSYCYLPLNYFEKKYETVFLTEENKEYDAKISAIDKNKSQFNQSSESVEERIGWIDAELSQMAEIIMGQSPPSSTYNENGIGLPFFQGKAEFTVLHPVVSKWCSKPKKAAESNDILISVRAPVGTTNIANQNCCIGRGLAAIRYSYCNKYVFYFLRLIEKELDKKGTGTTFKAISGAVLKSEIIPLSPLPEQRVIVSKIEQLFSELDNGIANLKLAQAQLKVYRQAVLKKAFEGELTREWREQQTDLPEAKDLLEQIQVEREESYNKKLDEWKRAVREWEDAGKEGKKPTKPKKSKETEPLTEPELDEFPKLPEKWEWTKIGQVSKVGTGVTPLKKRSDFYEGGTIPWVTSGALNESYVNLASDYVTDIALKETNLKIHPKNTLLIALYGEGKTRGKCSELLIEATTNQAIAAIVQERTEEKIRSYLKWFLTKNYDEIRIKSSGGVQPNLNLGIIENTVFPLCSLLEQHSIVTEIETRLSVCDKVEQDIEENLKIAEALRQSILKRAFEGKLLNKRELEEVHSAPDWEPAELLLERIRAEKAGSGKKGKA
ncbi:restriction endonuclease subunit S [Methanococcoides seepicolus]|uniref:Restriction endonuclease subunit S n=1 Tax=Methanococcoides seepicolus TaxID=2828780 RepID=A0A9E5DBP9_9EURY|nr:restriction endonuclease subunit S [Methanococcoides seepicolus]MCM1986638.1 restriction endonuclease subunit S [Methanococcoides seepicolus]